MSIEFRVHCLLAIIANNKRRHSVEFIIFLENSEQHTWFLDEINHSYFWLNTHLQVMCFRPLSSTSVSILIFFHLLSSCFWLQNIHHQYNFGYNTCFLILLRCHTSKSQIGCSGFLRKIRNSIRFADGESGMSSFVISNNCK